jgi:hypothetical protein
MICQRRLKIPTQLIVKDTLDASIISISCRQISSAMEAANKRSARSDLELVMCGSAR